MVNVKGGEKSKSTAGLFEVSCHLTGIYPDWWQGHRFESANDWWVCGVSSRDVQSVLQDRLLGKIGDFGTGFIPKESLDFDSLSDAKKAGVLVPSFRVKHKMGGHSTVTFKSYEQGREAFQGAPGISVLMDEEPPLEVYIEALMRTIAGNGRMILTFTPMKGISRTVLNFLGKHDIARDTGSLGPSRYLQRASWDNCPHLTEENKAALLAAMPPHQRDARTSGIPSLGSGAIYQTPESMVFVPPFKIPDYWPRCYGLDVGYNNTGACWMAMNPEDGTWYVYAEYLGQECLPSVNAAAIRGRGEWIPGAIDPASRGRGQGDGLRLLESYRDLGLELAEAKNSHGIIGDIQDAFAQGRLKIFETCSKLKEEYRMYRRDEKGQLVKENDHILDSMRYAWATGRAFAKTGEPVKQHHPGPVRWRG